MKLALLFGTLASVAQAHNWLSSPARANAGGNYNGFTSAPCPQKGSAVHLQVGAGQKFPIEWASGHGFGSSTYLVVLEASDEHHMRDHSAEMLDDYLASNPNKDYFSTYEDKVVYHVTKAALKAPPSTTGVAKTDWDRPTGFRQFEGGVNVYPKKEENLQEDLHAAYKNEKYPWIIAAHKLLLHEDTADESDLMWIEIPKGYPSGQYVVNYMWSGYYDCVDINVLSEPSTDIWGTKNPEVLLDRIDNCAFTDPKVLPFHETKCHEVDAETSDGIENCFTDCRANPGVGQYDHKKCEGVQVVPFKKPALSKYDGQFEGSHIPKECFKEGNKKLVMKDENNNVCFYIKKGPKQIVGPAYKVVRDPEDPVFYGTCYLRREGRDFEQKCPDCLPSDPPVGFRYGQDMCITCADQARNARKSAVPAWHPADKCFHCDRTLG